MKKRLQIKLRKWLGITDEMSDVWLCIRQLQDEPAPKPGATQAAVVVAKPQILPYEPDQKGNVVIAEPKILSVINDVHRV